MKIRYQFKNIDCVVIKVGTRVLTGLDNLILRKRIDRLADPHQLPVRFQVRKTIVQRAVTHRRSTVGRSAKVSADCTTIAQRPASGAAGVNCVTQGVLRHCVGRRPGSVA